MASSSSNAPTWEVISNADKGGLLVRRGPGSDHPGLPDRLSFGALVEEVKTEGLRSVCLIAKVDQ